MPPSSALHVGHGILPQLGALMRAAGLDGRVHVISDTSVLPLHGPAALDALRAAAYDAAATAVPAGEQSKSLAQASALYDWLVERRCQRRDVVVALGGGVVGDLAGFVAATFLRGLALVQVPTTLVGQVDSAIGGKVAVNHPRAKNLIGAFHQPRLIVADPALLATLPPRELRSGWAEVIKTAFILDAPLLDLLETRAEDLTRLEPTLVAAVVERCARHKLAVVAEDERDEGRRIILNYGHTVGHALEAATAYGALLHGEAVAIGMVAAARLAARLGLCDAALVARHERILRAFGLPTRAPAVAPEALRAAMALDKKGRGAQIRWVLLAAPADVRIVADVPEPTIDAVLAELAQ
jgi:3-dehydroquinate synthase